MLIFVLGSNLFCLTKTPNSASPAVRQLSDISCHDCVVISAFQLEFCEGRLSASSEPVWRGCPLMGPHSPAYLKASLSAVLLSRIPSLFLTSLALPNYSLIPQTTTLTVFGFSFSCPEPRGLGISLAKGCINVNLYQGSSLLKSQSSVL